MAARARDVAREIGATALDASPICVHVDVDVRDQLAALGANRRDGQVIVGFAAETGESGLDRARAKLERKGADLFVFNDVSQPGIGFDAPDNAVTLVSAAGDRVLPRAPKSEIAAFVLDEVEKLITHG